MLHGTVPSAPWTLCYDQATGAATSVIGRQATAVRALPGRGTAFGAVRTISVEALKPQDRHEARTGACGASYAVPPDKTRPCRFSFERRHNSITADELKEMLKVVNFPTLDALMEATVPASIRREVCPWASGAKCCALPSESKRLADPRPARQPMDLGKYNQPMTESEHLTTLKCVEGLQLTSAHAPEVLTGACLRAGAWRRRTRL